MTHVRLDSSDAFAGGGESFSSASIRCRRGIQALAVVVLLFLSAGGSLAQWNWQSPHPQGNTLLRVQFIDSSSGWAVGEYGTALHTSDGGASWYEQEYARTDNLLGLAMVSDTVGWAAGDNGTILHTTNGGDDWLEQTSGISSGLNTIYFLDDLRGWAAGDNETILRTTNGGLTWTIQHQSLSPPSSINSIFFIDSSEGWGVGSNRMLLHTTDGGAIWTKQVVGITPSTYLTVTFVTPALGFIGGSGGVILRTDNGGLNWTETASGVTGSLNQIVMQNSFVGWIGGDAGLLLKTINGGLSWSHITVGGGENINSLSRFGGILWGVGEYGKMFVSTNSGVSWTDLDAGSRLSANWIDFASDSVGVAVGQTGLILRTTDGGASWAESSSPAPAMSTYGVAHTDASHAWAVGDDGTILRTTDGSVWSLQSCPVTHTLFGVTFGDAANGWIVGGEFSGLTGVILHSSDGGGSWGVQSGGIPNILYGVSFPNGMSGWAVGENGTILRTTNGGGSWAPQTSGVSGALFWCSFADAQNGWAVGEQGTILHTSNGGSVWSKQPSGVSSNLFSVVQRGTSEAFAVGDNGVILHTTDTGINWEREYSRTQYNLYGVAHGADSNVWVSGDYGTILANGVPRETGGTVTGLVFNDLNNNAQLDFGEPGMQGWTVHLGGDRIDSVKTGPSGLFRFTGLPVGSYTLDEDLRPGWTRTFPVAAPYGFTLSAGAPNSTADFGNAAPNAYSYSVNGRWNLVSLSLEVSDPRTTTLYDAAISEAYAFGETYTTEDTIVSGRGYWIKFPAAQALWILGTPVTAESIAVRPGWNLIGSVQDTLTAASVSSSPPGNVVSSFFAYEGGYRADTKLIPGDGYWVQVKDSGVLYLGNGAAAAGKAQASAGGERPQFNSIRFSDPAGNSQALSFGSASAADDFRSWSALPPLPPAEAFDARFSDGSGIAQIDPARDDARSAVILLQSAGMPLTVSWNIRRSGTQTYALTDLRTGALLARGLADSGQITLTGPALKRLALSAEGGDIAARVPREFSLKQNFPNPFNPATSIRFELPARSSVRLSIYSVLGQEVATLVDAELDAGEHTAAWAPSGASGLYFYRLEATDLSGSGRHFSAIRKMLLLK